MGLGTPNNETLQLVTVVKSIILWLRFSMTVSLSNDSYLFI